MSSGKFLYRGAKPHKCRKPIFACFEENAIWQCKCGRKYEYKRDWQGCLGWDEIEWDNTSEQLQTLLANNPRLAGLSEQEIWGDIDD